MRRSVIKIAKELEKVIERGIAVFVFPMPRITAE
jgi:hypothetical protein